MNHERVALYLPSHWRNMCNNSLHLTSYMIYALHAIKSITFITEIFKFNYPVRIYKPPFPTLMSV